MMTKQRYSAAFHETLRQDYVLIHSETKMTKQPPQPPQQLTTHRTDVKQHLGSTHELKRRLRLGSHLCAAGYSHAVEIYRKRP